MAQPHATDTSKYKLNHSMLRVKDPERTMKFYGDNFGMKLVNKLDFPESKFSLFFLGLDTAPGKHWTDREGLLELTHNYGSENDPDFKVANGNEEPHRGFGHIAISVDNITAVCDKLEKNGVRFQKKLTDGRQKNIAFTLDPDGYWVEIIPLPEQVKGENTDKSTYKFNHTMIRVKDPEKSLQFYRSVLGMSLIRTMEFPEAKFNLFFLAYRKEGENEPTEGSLPSDREGVLELTWNYGTESDPNFKGYHTGNTEPKGFGHICVSVDDLDQACARFDDLQVNYKKRLTDGTMKDLAFILDPDGYWVEIIQNEGLKKRVAW